LVKTTVRSVTSALAAIAVLTAAVPAPPALVQIVQLEQARSLGNGRLAAYLRAKDRSTVLRATLAIGRTKQPAGIPLLLPGSKSADPALRAMSVYAIGLIGGGTAGVPVLHALTDHADNVLVAALDAADRLETAHLFDPASERKAVQRVRALLASPAAAVRARAATTLESFSTGAQSRAAMNALAAAYAREKDGYVRWHIVWSLYRGYSAVAPASLLGNALRDSNEVVRIEAVRAFGKRGDASAAALLKPLLNDPSWRVQEQTLESIRVLQGGKMTEHLGAIPNGVNTPAPQPEPFASLPALPRTPVTGKPERPDAAAVTTQPTFDPQTLAQFAGPQNGAHPRVRLVTTKGNIYLELYPAWAPLTVENFLNLANRGYYDNNRWFRIVPDFVVQTGDPTNTGNGDAGYMIPAEENPIEQDSYVLSMGLNYTDPPNAHAIRDSAGTQFYITLSPQLHLDRDFTVFGKVIAGQDVLGRLVESDKIIRVERLPDSKS
jgi:peptidyl-prolyl cis-trans isomerase B (cyclophilin B)